MNELDKMNQKHGVHVYETENNVIVSMNLPNIDKKDISLKIKDEFIEISIKKQLQKEKTEECYHIKKSESGFYYQKIHLPFKVDSTKPDASYNNGILRVEIPKIAKKQKNDWLEIR